MPLINSYITIADIVKLILKNNIGPIFLLITALVIAIYWNFCIKSTTANDRIIAKCISNGMLKVKLMESARYISVIDTLASADTLELAVKQTSIYNPFVKKESAKTVGLNANIKYVRITGRLTPVSLIHSCGMEAILSTNRADLFRHSMGRGRQFASRNCIVYYLASGMPTLILIRAGKSARRMGYLCLKNFPNTPSGNLEPAVACRYNSPISKFSTFG